MDATPPLDEANLPAIDGSLAAVLLGDDAALATMPGDQVSVDALLAYAGDPRFATALADMPRPRLDAGAHPARLILRAVARMLRFDTASPDLGMDFLEALDASLAQGLDAWAGICARDWVNFRHHSGDEDGTLAHMHSLLERYPIETLPPRVASPLALLATRTGAIDLAERLWRHARGHEDLRASARAAWLVEQEWAQGWLMLVAGQPGLAAAAMRRVHAGLEQWDDEPARLRTIEAGMELGFALILAGRCSEAVTSLDHSIRVLAAEPEFVAWLTGLRAVAHALLGDVDEARDALEVAAQASTDTLTLDLNAVLPARMLVAALSNDRPTLDACIAEARHRLAERTVDVEQHVVWRMFALLALHAVGDTETFRGLAEEVRACVDETSVPIPLYAAHAELIIALGTGDRAGVATARLDLQSRAVVLRGDALDPWAFLGHVAGEQATRPSSRRVRLEVLDGLQVYVDDVPIEMRAWAGRRKSRTVLALLVAAGCRIDRDTLLDGLWSTEHGTPSNAPRVLATVLSQIRSTLGAAGAELQADEEPGARSLRARGPVAQLTLQAGDQTDVADLAALAKDVSGADPRDRTRLERAARRLVPLVAGVPLRDIGGEQLVVSLQASLMRAQVDAIGLVVGRWLQATGPEQASPTTELLEIAHSAVRIDRFDEVALGNCVELLARAGRVAEATRAFHDFRSRLDEELGLQPSLELVRRHAAIVD